MALQCTSVPLRLWFLVSSLFSSQAYIQGGPQLPQETWTQLLHLLHLKQVVLQARRRKPRRPFWWALTHKTHCCNALIPSCCNAPILIILNPRPPTWCAPPTSQPPLSVGSHPWMAPAQPQAPNPESPHPPGARRRRASRPCRWAPRRGWRWRSPKTPHPESNTHLVRAADEPAALVGGLPDVDGAGAVPGRQAPRRAAGPVQRVALGGVRVRLARRLAQRLAARRAAVRRRRQVRQLRRRVEDLRPTRPYLGFWA